jgi:hypothetical protein
MRLIKHLIAWYVFIVIAILTIYNFVPNKVATIRPSAPRPTTEAIK